MSIPTPFIPAPDPNEELKKRIANTKDHVKEISLANATPLKAKLPQSKGKPMPTTYRHVLKIEWCRQFPWRERLRILFGGNLVVAIGVAVQHNPGAFQPMILGKVTNELSPDNYMRDLVQNLIEERKDLKDPVVHENKQGPETL